MWSLLSLAHLLGLSLSVGAASVKLVLLLKSRSDPGFAPTFLAVARPVTRLIVLGLALLTLSGIAWLFLGAQFTPLLITKIVLVVMVWGIGPYIDNVIEPRFARLLPAPGAAPSADFAAVHRRYVVAECAATGLLYALLIIGWKV